MKKLFKVLITLLMVTMLSAPALFAGCGNKDSGNDFAGKLKLDFSTDSKKLEVTVKQLVDGDTTHFNPVAQQTIPELVGKYNPADFAATEGYIKARYLAINTPESTAKVEPWGKKASVFTNGKLSKAKKIVVESDDSAWHLDSTGARYLLWVWYIPEDGTEFRNLNIEILQNGYAIASNTAQNRYGEVAMAALMHATSNKLVVFSGKDPGYPYGSAVVVTIRELRSHVEDYVGQKVKVEGVIVADINASVYIEDYDAELGINFGISAYYQSAFGGLGDVLKVGNRVSIVGFVNHYTTELFDAYQLSGLTFNDMKPDADGNTKIVSQNNEAMYKEISASDLMTKKITLHYEKVEDNQTTPAQTEIAFGEVIMGSSVTVSNLQVTSTSTSADGEITLSCKAADGTITNVRTTVLTDAQGNKVTADRFANKTITVKGIVDKFRGEYQIKCNKLDLITIVG